MYQPFTSRSQGFVWLCCVWGFHCQQQNVKVQTEGKNKLSAKEIVQRGSGQKVCPDLGLFLGAVFSLVMLLSLTVVNLC